MCVTAKPLRRDDGQLENSALLDQIVLEDRHLELK
jgi:hypothetical protein